MRPTKRRRPHRRGGIGRLFGDLGHRRQAARAVGRHVAPADRTALRHRELHADAPRHLAATRSAAAPARGRDRRLQVRVELQHGLHVVLRFLVVRDLVARALHRALARVVGGQRQFDLAREHRDQVAQVAGAGGDVDARVEQLLLDGGALVRRHAVALCGGGHELHQSHGALGRDGLRVETGLGGNQRLQQLVVDRMLARRIAQRRLGGLVAGRGLEHGQQGLRGRRHLAVELAATPAQRRQALCRVEALSAAKEDLVALVDLLGSEVRDALAVDVAVDVSGVRQPCCVHSRKANSNERLKTDMRGVKGVRHRCRRRRREAPSVRGAPPLRPCP